MAKNRQIGADDFDMMVAFHKYWKAQKESESPPVPVKKTRSGRREAPIDPEKSNFERLRVKAMEGRKGSHMSGALIPAGMPGQYSGTMPMPMPMPGPMSMPMPMPMPMPGPMSLPYPHPGMPMMPPPHISGHTIPMHYSAGVMPRQMPPHRISRRGHRLNRAEFMKDMSTFDGRHIVIMPLDEFMDAVATPKEFTAATTTHEADEVQSEPDVVLPSFWNEKLVNKEKESKQKESKQKKPKERESKKHDRATHSEQVPPRAMPWQPPAMPYAGQPGFPYNPRSEMTAGWVSEHAYPPVYSHQGPYPPPYPPTQFHPNMAIGVSAPVMGAMNPHQQLSYQQQQQHFLRKQQEFYAQQQRFYEQYPPHHDAMRAQSDMVHNRPPPLVAPVPTKHKSSHHRASGRTNGHSTTNGASQMERGDAQGFAPPKRPHRSSSKSKPRVDANGGSLSRKHTERSRQHSGAEGAELAYLDGPPSSDDEVAQHPPSSSDDEPNYRVTPSHSSPWGRNATDKSGSNPPAFESVVAQRVNGLGSGLEMSSGHVQPAQPPPTQPPQMPNFYPYQPNPYQPHSYQPNPYQPYPYIQPPYYMPPEYNNRGFRDVPAKPADSGQSSKPRAATASDDDDETESVKNAIAFKSFMRHQDILSKREKKGHIGRNEQVYRSEMALLAQSNPMEKLKQRVLQQEMQKQVTNAVAFESFQQLQRQNKLGNAHREFEETKTRFRDVAAVELAYGMGREIVPAKTTHRRNVLPAKQTVAPPLGPLRGGVLESQTDLERQIRQEMFKAVARYHQTS